MILRYLRLLPLLSCIALAWPLDPAQASPDAPQRILFPHEDASDLRGLLNVFHAFRLACLDHPTTPDLPAKLVPEGYRVVDFNSHLLGTQGSDPTEAAVLSKTGSEEEDFAGGHPFVYLSPPTDKAPRGSCSVTWKRKWDQPDAARAISLDMAALLAARVSYHLRALLLSPPDQVFRQADSYSFTQDWGTLCWAGYECRFDIVAFFEAEGIHLIISRREARPRS